MTVAERIHTVGEEATIPIEDYWFVVEAGEQEKEWVVHYEGGDEYAVFELGEEYQEDEWNYVNVTGHGDLLCDGGYFQYHAECPHVEAVGKIEGHELDRCLAMLNGSDSRDLL